MSSRVTAILGRRISSLSTWKATTTRHCIVCSTISHNTGVSRIAQQQQQQQMSTASSSSSPLSSTASASSTLYSSFQRYDEAWAEIQLSNSRTEGQVEIRSTETRGWGIYAMKRFEPDECVMRSEAQSIVHFQTKHSVQIGWDRHVHMNLPARFVNHICNEANVGIRYNDISGSYDFYSLRIIEPHDEVLWDYETTEYEINDFVCQCGTPNCRGQLRGYKWHKDDILKAYGGKFVAPYLLQGDGNITPPTVILD